MMVPSLSTRQRDARLHVKFAKEHKQVWMDGTHSFGELQTLLSETGLDGLTAVKVQIGQASMENKSRGKGLRTEEEQQAVDWLLRRSKKRQGGAQDAQRIGMIDLRETAHRPFA
jgi:hypothetical protein